MGGGIGIRGLVPCLAPEPGAPILVHWGWGAPEPPQRAVPWRQDRAHLHHPTPRPAVTHLPWENLPPPAGISGSQHLPERHSRGDLNKVSFERPWLGRASLLAPTCLGSPAGECAGVSLFSLSPSRWLLPAGPQGAGEAERGPCCELGRLLKAPPSWAALGGPCWAVGHTEGRALVRVLLCEALRLSLGLPVIT